MIYKVNGHADYFSIYQKKFPTEKADGAQSACVAAPTGDRVEISANAASRTKLEKFKKESVQEMACVPQQRLDALKRAYSDNNCPVSDQAVADALLNCRLGQGEL